MKDVRHELAVVKDAITSHTVSNLDEHLHSADVAKAESLPEVYVFVRPLLLFCASFLSFKPAWSNGILALVKFLDLEYPDSVPALAAAEEPEEETDTKVDTKPRPGAGKKTAAKNAPGKSKLK